MSRNAVLTRSQTAAARNNARRLYENFAAARSNINVFKLLTRDVPTVTRILLQGRPSISNVRNLSEFIGRSVGYSNRQNVDKIYRLLLDIVHLKVASRNSNSNQKNLGLRMGRIVAELFKARPKGNGKQKAIMKGFVMGIIETLISPRLARIYGSWYAT